ncbi:MAG: NTP transferase domain-containing protein [Desulfomonile tiedjei]|uniref:NTP transferase domain-containing protein n=1 Tax=Desulfomonile tiedjei TaxID=2358 RepID=A0A9D6UZW5_9BACT|nr:NTP transferase domain-containing protein [Desulfomonile tiedjei]
MRAIILAGGKGTRLMPYTAVIPKPLMPVGEMPIVEILIKQLQRTGVDRITFALGHLAHLVQAVVGDGEKFGVRIDYSIEDKRLGTSGPLTLIHDLDETFMVLNGDVLTDLNFEDITSFHKSHQSTITIACHKRTVNIDYGVIHRNGFEVTRYEEKPKIELYVSMGVYVFDPAVLKYLPQGSYLDFPDLVDRLIDRKDKVLIYPHDGIWFDLGRLEDFNMVHEIWDDLKDKIILNND